MTETSTRSIGFRRGARRVLAVLAALGLASVGILAAGPAVAAAEPAAIIAVAGTPAAEPEPIMEVLDETVRPLGLSIFVISALTVGAGGIVTARLLAARKPQPALVESRD